MTANGSDITLQITADAKEALSTITALISKVKELSTTLDGLNTSNKTSAISQSIQSIADATKDLGESAKTVNKVADALSTVSNDGEKVNNVTQSLEKLSTVANDVAEPLQNIKNSVSATSLDNLSNSAKTATERFAELSPELKKVDGLKMNKFSSKVLDEMRNKAQLLREEYAKLYETISKKSSNKEGYTDSSSYEKDVARLEGIRNSYNALLLKQKELSVNGGVKFDTKGLERFGEVLKVIGSSIVKITKQIGGLIFKMTQLGNLSTLVKKATQSFSKANEDLSKKLFRTAKMLRLMVVRMALRKVIDEVSNGFKSLALHSESFNTAISSLISGSKKLGYSFSAMLAPLIEALAPALLYVINLLTKLINIINQVFSALSGGATWNKAKDFTDDYAQSVKDANKSAKELKKTVLGFDELNQLTDKTTSGGDTSKNIVDMYETEAIEKKWKDLAQWLKDMWNKGDFYELGKKLGEQFKAWLDAIPWDEIRETSNKLGKCLATLINGLVEVEGLGRSIGTTLAQSLNTVFEFVNGFVHNLHWSSVGKFIADTFNGFFDGIDWDLIKDTFITGFRGLADAIWAFIKNFKWDNLSEAISNLTNTLSESIYEFFNRKSYDDRGFELNESWASRLGTELGRQLKKAIDGIDWEMLGKALGSIVQSAIDFVKGFLNGDDGIWESIKTAISDLLKGFFESVDKEDLAKVIAGIIGASILASIPKILALKAIKDIGTSILTKAFASAVGSKAIEGSVVESTSGALIGASNNSTLTTTVATVGGKIGSGLVSAIGGALLNLGASITVVDAFKHLKDTKELSQLNEQLANGQISLDEYKKSVDGVKDSTYGWKDALKDFFTGKGVDLESLGANYKTHLNEIRTVTDDVKESTSKASSAVSGGLSTIKDNVYPVKESFKGFGDTAQSTISITVEKTKQLADQLKNDKAIPSYSKEGQDSFNKLQKTADQIKFEKVITGAKKMDSESSPAFKNIEEKTTKMRVTVENETANLNASMSAEMITLKKTVDDGANDIEQSTNTIKEGFNADKWTLDGIKEGLKASFEGGIEAIKQVWNKFANWMNENVKIKIEPIKIMGKTVFDGTEFNLFKLPTFATGGFPEDGLFMANHSEMVGQFSNGKTAVANNEQIVAGIKQGVYEAVAMAMSNSNSGSGQYINNTIQIDGETIARAVTKGQNSIARRYSPTMA